MKQVRVGVIGCGGIAERAHIPNLLAEPQVRLGALSDINEGKLLAIQQKFNFPKDKSYTDYAKVLDLKDVDAVVIATPTHTHAEIALKAIEAGKHVFVEKPLSVTVAQAEAIVESPRPASRVHVLGIGKQPVPLQCQMCEDAPCASVCPTKSLYRPEPNQPVLFRRDICIGCSSCVLVCPFGVLMRADGGIMAKCDLCWERLAEGKKPSCVEACPTKARKLVPANAVAEDKLRKAAQALARLETQEGTELAAI